MTRESPRAPLRAALVPVLLALVALTAMPAAAGEAPDTTAAADTESRPVNPRYVLLDTRGRMVGNEDFPGRFQLITFGYTFCPDVCPTTLATMAQVRQRLGALGERQQRAGIVVALHDALARRQQVSKLGHGHSSQMFISELGCRPVR